jgi:hypothetical protein
LVPVLVAPVPVSKIASDTVYGKENPAMKKYLVILSTVSLVLLIGVFTPHFAQNAPTDSDKSDQKRHQQAVGLLRTINTAEVVEFTNYGSYASWETFLAHQPNSLNKFLATNYPQGTSIHFADMPEILPGWSLRFNLRADGRGYDVRVQDLTDKI